MYAPELKDKIAYFVRSFGQVELAQVKYMFREYDPVMVDGCVHKLIVEGRMFMRDTLCTRSEDIIGTPFTQKMITKSAWVLAYYGAKKVLEYYIAQYPFQVFFILEDLTCYDVTAMNTQTAFSTSSAAKRVFDMTTAITPNGTVKDTITHIAVVLGQGDPKELVSPNFFDYYAIIDDNTVKLKPISKRKVTSEQAKAAAKKSKKTEAKNVLKNGENAKSAPVTGV